MKSTVSRATSVPTTNNIGEDDNQAVQGVSGGAGAMAFIPYSFYQENLDTVKGLAIDSGSRLCGATTVENLLAGDYTPLRPWTVHVPGFVRPRAP